MLSRLLLLIRRIESTVLVTLLGAMIFLAGAQIILRNLFDSGISWSDPVLRVLVLWVGMVGAMIATQQDKHIRIDLLSRYLSPSWRTHTARLNHFFGAIVCGLLAWHSARFVYFEWQDGALLISGLPSWIAECVIPLGFAVMTLRFALLMLLGDSEEKS